MELRGESIGGVDCEVGFISTGDASLALTRVPAAGGGHGSPVILVHGSYTRRNFWISPKGIGLAPFLAERGFDVWIPELRGHGASPKGEHFSSWTAEDHIRLDLPAIQRAVSEHTGRDTLWVGHSAGGLFIVAALAVEWLDRDTIAGIVTLGSQVDRGDPILKVPPVVWLMRVVMRVLGHFPAPRFGMGPEVEPAGEMKEYARWKGLGGRWTTSGGRSYHEALASLRVPWLAFGGAADRNDPAEGCRLLLETSGGEDRSWVLLARAEGFSRDYGHSEMIVSRAAQREVWPRIAAWLDAHRPNTAA